MAEPTLTTQCPLCRRTVALDVSIESAHDEQGAVAHITFEPMKLHIERHSEDPDGRWSELEIRKTLFSWTAAAAALKAWEGTSDDDPYNRGLADGYVGALKLILTTQRS